MEMVQTRIENFRVITVPMQVDSLVKDCQGHFWADNKGELLEFLFPKNSEYRDLAKKLYRNEFKSNVSHLTAAQESSSDEQEYNMPSHA